MFAQDRFPSFPDINASALRETFLAGLLVALTTLLGGCGGGGSSEPEVVPVAPSFTAQPGNVTINEGLNALFSVAVTGTPVPTLQWQKSVDGGASWNDIGGATETQLSLASPGTSESFTRYRAVANNTAGTDTSDVGVLIVNGPTPPVTVDDEVSTTVNTSLDLASSTLLANDTDVNGDTLTVIAVSNAVNGTVVIASGTSTFVPTADFVGTAGFDYDVSDGVLMDTGHVTVTITP